MKKILMLLAFAGVTSVASAQQTMTVTEYEVIQVQDKYQVITNPFWSNWFFSVGGGAQVLYGNNDHIGKFRDRVAPTFNVSVGKWVTPGFGVRLQYSGLQAKGFTMNETADYVVGGPREDGSYKQRWDYMNLHGDLMINLNALFGGYNPDRIMRSYLISVQVGLTPILVLIPIRLLSMQVLSTVSACRMLSI